MEVKSALKISSQVMFSRQIGKQLIELKRPIDTIILSVIFAATKSSYMILVVSEIRTIDITIGDVFFIALLKCNHAAWGEGIFKFNAFK